MLQMYIEVWILKIATMECEVGKDRTQSNEEVLVMSNWKTLAGILNLVYFGCSFYWSIKVDG